MFIRFEQDSTESRAGTSKTVPCPQGYTQQTIGSQKFITIDGTDIQYILAANSPDHWQRAYAMNDQGETIEFIHAPKEARHG